MQEYNSYKHTVLEQTSGHNKDIVACMSKHIRIPQKNNKSIKSERKW